MDNINNRNCKSISSIKDGNVELYDIIWRNSKIQNPSTWTMWKITKDFKCGNNLEVGPGNRPRIPVIGNHFMDTSPSAVKNLERAGGMAVVGDITNAPFKNDFFDTVTIIEVLEHIYDDGKAFSEIARILKPAGLLFFSVPVGMRFFSKVDQMAGHQRRYEIEEILELLSKNHFRGLKFQRPSFFVRIFYRLGDVFFSKATPERDDARKSLRGLIFPNSKRFINFQTKLMAFFQKMGG